MDEYIDSWHATMQLLREGKSFSGRERNCVFLNTGAAPFANISAVSGLDFADDGRAVAIVDWDHDGDLDMWVQNRTGPRLRYLSNQLPTHESENKRFVAVRLQGVSCNRDAIGARVELKLKERQDQSIATLRAGDGYLSQSSKWLHFGLGDASEIEFVRVRWPDGTEDEYREIKTGGRYRLTQGGGAVDVRQSRDLAIHEERQVSYDPPPKRRTVLATPIPLPLLGVHDTASSNETQLVVAANRPLLLVLWASWCPNCLQELSELAQQRELLQAEGVDVMAINVDALSTSDESRHPPDEVLTKLRFSFPAVYASEDFVDKVMLLQRVILNREYGFAVPTSLLVDPNNQLIAFYQGQIGVQTILEDARLATGSIAERRDAAVPFPGTWTSTPSMLMLRPVAGVYRDAGFVRDYEHYLELERIRFAKMLDAAEGPEQLREIKLRQASAGFDLALSFLGSGRSDLAIEYFQLGLKATPESIPGRYYLARAYVSQQRIPEAIAVLQEAVELDPSDFRSRRDLSVLLVQVGKTAEAVPHLVAATTLKPDNVEVWTNLGVSLAQLNRFEEATPALRTAVKYESGKIHARLTLAGVLARQGEFAKAAEMFRLAAQDQPNSGPALAGLGQALAELRDDRAAADALTRATQLNDRDAGSQLKLAWLRATSELADFRDGQAALVVAAKLAQQTRNRDPRVLDVVAAALAELGDYERAVQAAEQALKLLPEDQAMHAAIKRRLDLYKSQQPYREGSSAAN